MCHLRGVASSIFFSVGNGGGDLVGRECSILFGNSGGSGGGEYRGNGSHGFLSALSFV
jgi:hypothetical protein